MSVTAYVLIQTEVGRAEKVATAARDIAGVVAADNVAGPYDVIVKTEAMLWPKVIRPVTFSLAYSGNLSAIGAAALALHRELDIL